MMQNDLDKSAALLFEAGEYTLAKNIYIALIKTGDDKGKHLYFLARCYEHLGDLQEAIKQYEEAIVFRQSVEAYQRLAGALMQDKKELYAVEILDRALCLKHLSTHQRFELHKASGNALTRLMNVQEAEAHYRSALEINPDAEEIQSNLGTLYLQSGRIQDAKRAFEDAVAANQANCSAWVGLGCCLMALNLKNEAVRCFASALEIEIRNPTAIFYLVKCAYETKNYVAAERLVSKYVETAPVSANLLYSLAGLHYHLGRVEDAHKVASKVLQIKADHHGAHELVKMIASRRTHGSRSDFNQQERRL